MTKLCDNCKSPMDRKPLFTSFYYECPVCTPAKSSMDPVPTVGLNHKLASIHDLNGDTVSIYQVPRGSSKPCFSTGKTEDHFVEYPKIVCACHRYQKNYSGDWIESSSLHMKTESQYDTPPRFAYHTIEITLGTEILAMGRVKSLLIKDDEDDQDEPTEDESNS